jgi:hypothetical protein
MDTTAQTPPEEPLVTYTVKEMLARIDTKLDIYVKRQEIVEGTVRPIAAEHQHLVDRVFALELTSMNKKAVMDARTTTWRRLAGLAGVFAVASSFLTILELLKVIH